MSQIAEKYSDKLKYLIITGAVIGLINTLKKEKIKWKK